MQSYELYCGNNIDVLRKMDTNSVDCVVTSPPYFQMRRYTGSNDEIGIEESVDEYISKLVEVFKECARVVKESGAIWINIDDKYAGKGLMGIPDRLKIRLMDEGLVCRNEVIWQKPNAMPSSAKDRFNNDYEKMYFFVKNSDYYFDTRYEPCTSDVHVVKNAQNRMESKYKDVQQESSVRQGINRERGSKIIAIRRNLPEQLVLVEFLRKRTSAKALHEQTGISKTCLEHWFRRDTVGFAYPRLDHWEMAREFVNDGSEEFKEIDKGLTDVSYESDAVEKNLGKGRVMRAVWSISTSRSSEQHFAPFPAELVRIPIEATCPPMGVVLDPFMGSGTTGVVALSLGRKFIGIDLSEEYVSMARKRLEEDRKV